MPSRESVIEILITQQLNISTNPSRSSSHTRAHQQAAISDIDPPTNHGLLFNTDPNPKCLVWMLTCKMCPIIHLSRGHERKEVVERDHYHNNKDNKPVTLEGWELAFDVKL